VLAAGTVLSGVARAETKKLIDTTLLKATEQFYRWSEGSTIALDDKGHLLMGVTMFGPGGHDHTPGAIYAFHSYDGGLTWTSLEQAKILQENVGKQNTMSPALLRLDNGEILCFVNVKNSMRDCGPWVKRSSDGGKTWGPLQRLPYDGYGGVGCDRAIQISTGRVLLPCWVSLDELKSSHAWVFYSDDRGRVWRRTDLISVPKGSSGRATDPAAEEPMIVELRDGRLMMILRTYLTYIYKCHSSDGGATWTPPQNSGIPSPGSMATLKRMPDGNLLLIWNWAPPEKINGPWPRDFLSTAVSTDEGRNFTSVRHLDGQTNFEGKITMANVTFVGDRAVITYSKSPNKKNHYSWQLQVIPLKWFYEGDRTLVYGEKYLVGSATASEKK